MPDASFDAIPCEMRTPVEVVAGLHYIDLNVLWRGAASFGSIDGSAVPLPNGDLLASGTGVREQFTARLRSDGSASPSLRYGRYGIHASNGERGFFVSDALTRAEPGAVYFQVGVYDVASGLLGATSRLTEYDPRCEGVARWSPVVSGERNLVIRGVCSPTHTSIVILERWEQQGAEMVRTVGPIEAPDPGDRSLLGNTTVSADGHGGLWYLGGVPTADGTNYTVHAVHWDGTDTPPTLSLPLGDPPEPGQHAFGAFGEVLASGDYLMAINAVSRGFTRTWVARVRPDMSFAWTWTSPAGFVSGPDWVAADTFGDETRLLLYQPASRMRVYVQGLDADGHEVWPEPHEIRSLEGLGTPEFHYLLEQTRLVMHAEGAFTAYSASSAFPEITLFDAQASPQSTSTAGGGSDFGTAMYSDGNFGVWMVTLGYIQHHDRTGWPLYRSWFYGESCGNERPGIVTRTGPEAEPMTYFYDNGWPPRPRQ